MASPQFPQRKSAGAGGMTGGDASLLDSPPPTPVAPDGMQVQPGGNAAAAPMPSFDQLAQPLTAGSPGKVLSPEISMGLMQMGETIAGTFDSMASIAPECAMDFAMLKDLLQRTLGKILVKSGQTASVSAAGNQFPGGGYSGGYSGGTGGV